MRKESLKAISLSAPRSASSAVTQSSSCESWAVGHRSYVLEKARNATDKLPGDALNPSSSRCFYNSLIKGASPYGEEEQACSKEDGASEASAMDETKCPRTQG